MQLSLLLFSLVSLSACFKVGTNINNVSYQLTTHATTDELVLDGNDGLDLKLDQTSLKVGDSIVGEVDIYLKLISNSTGIGEVGTWSIENDEYLVYSRQLFYCGTESPYHIHAISGENCQELTLMVQNEVLENYGFDDHSDTTITSTITLTVTSYSSSTINCVTTEERFDQIIFAEEDYMAFEGSEITETTTTIVTLINSFTTTATTCTESLAEETQSDIFNHGQSFNIIGSYNVTEFLFTINGTSITFSCEPGEFTLEEGYLKVANEAVQISHDGKLVIDGEGASGWSVVDEKLMLTTTTKFNTTISQAVEFQVCREGDTYWVGIGSDPDCVSIDAVVTQSVHQQQDETSCNNQDAGEVLKKILFQGILEDDYVTLDDTPTETPTLNFYSTTTVTKSATTIIITTCSGIEEHAAASPELFAVDSVSLEPNLYTSVTITLTIFSTVPDVMSTPTPKPATPTNSSKAYDPIAYLLENRSVSIKSINKTTVLFYFIVHTLVQMFI